MTTNEIRIEMIRNNVTTTSIAKSIGAYRQHVSMVIHDRMRTRRIQEGVAAAIKKTVDEVFPITKEAA